MKTKMTYRHIELIGVHGSEFHLTVREGEELTICVRLWQEPWREKIKRLYVQTKLRFRMKFLWRNS